MKTMTDMHELLVAVMASTHPPRQSYPRDAEWESCCAAHDRAREAIDSHRAQKNVISPVSP